MEIGFIGAGKVSKALGLYFINHGLKISGYYSRSFSSAEAAAQITGSTAFETLSDVILKSSLIFICVPDGAFGDVDDKISNLSLKRLPGKKPIFIHVSGAHPSSCLCKTINSGYEVGSMHPLESFGDPYDSARRLENTYFTIEGDTDAVNSIKTILSNTGARFSLITPKAKPIYHAGACVVSNFLVTLIDAGISLFEAAGMDKKDIFEAIEPLIFSTLENIKQKGTVSAITGPIVRADFNTIESHMKIIKKLAPEQLEFYKSLAQRTALMLENKRLTPEQTQKIKEILEGN